MLLAPDEHQAGGCWTLEHKSGKCFVLGEGFVVLSLGRSDAKKSWVPDIDLDGVDCGKTVSRNHAVLIVTPYFCLLRVERWTRNPTYVNGAIVQRGIALPVRQGDRLNLGLVELRLDRARTQCSV